MLDYLLRQVLLLLQPLGLIWATLGVLTWRCRRTQRRIAVTTGALFVFIFIVGSTDFPGWLLRTQERPWAGVNLDTLPKADAIVVLGGGAEPSRYEMGGLHLTRAGDRLLMGLELARRELAGTLIVSGGAADFDGDVRSESAVVRAWLENWKLPAHGEVLDLGVSGNTHDEARKVAKVARERGWQRVLLVTSANHMRRATALFRTQGVDFVAVPCNFLTTVSTAPAPFRLSVPNSGGLEKISIWAHEQIGWWTYRARGWISREAAE
jgi:uncharacterized SAM-binding protein YcdF (DUF218 family)